MILSSSLMKTGKQEQVNSGEAFVIPKGYDCQWIQSGYCRKFFVIYENADKVIDELTDEVIDKVMPAKPTFEGIVNFNNTVETSNVEVKVTGDSFKVKENKPVQKGQHRYKDHSGNFFAGVWKSDSFETKMQPFPRNEFIYIQEGSLICIDEHGREHTFNSGDAFFVPQGTVCYWRVLESVFTYYAVLQ